MRAPAFNVRDRHEPVAAGGGRLVDDLVAAFAEDGEG